MCPGTHLLAFGSLVLGALLSACQASDATPVSEVPCVCAEPPPAPACPPPPACPAQAVADPTTVSLDANLRLDTPLAKRAVEIATSLQSGNIARVRSQFGSELAKELSEERVKEIVDQVFLAHGPPERILDAWEGTITEYEQNWVTASVLMRMSRSPTRFRMLVVFTRQGRIKGFWLKPI